jgi:putative endonuclease
MSNASNTVTYTGITNNLYRRIYEHNNKIIKGFTTRYHITKLVCYEDCEDVQSAISREKQIKSWSRKDKVKLIQTHNANWRDLYEDLIKG